MDEAVFLDDSLTHRRANGSQENMVVALSFNRPLLKIDDYYELENESSASLYASKRSVNI